MSIRLLLPSSQQWRQIQTKSNARYREPLLLFVSARRRPYTMHGLSAKRESQLTALLFVASISATTMWMPSIDSSLLKQHLTLRTRHFLSFYGHYSANGAVIEAVESRM